MIGRNKRRNGINVLLVSTFLLLLILVMSVIADKHDTIFQEQLAKSGIDPSAINGCTNACRLSNGILTLQGGATLNQWPQGVQQIHLNGGNMQYSGAVISGSSTLTTGTPIEVLAGRIAFNPKSKTTNLRFTNSLLEPETGQVINGNGRIVNGRIIIDDAKVDYKGVSAHVQNAEVVDSTAELHLLAGKGVKIDGVEVEENRVVSVGNENGKTTLFVGDLWDRDKNKFAKDSPPPVIKINGKPDLIIKDHAKLNQDNPLTLYLNGERHVFLGSLDITKGNIAIKPNEELEDGRISPAMIDGVYVNTKKNLPIFFDDNPHKGSYLGLGDKLHAVGNGYEIAISTGGKSLSEEFWYEFKQHSAYVSKPDAPPVRLNFKLDGDDSDPPSIAKITIDPKIKQIKVEGGATILNGPNALIYYEEDGKQRYNFLYEGCKTGIFSCGELGYEMTDSQRVNVIEEKNTVAPSTGKDKLKMNFGDEKKKQPYNANLDKSRVYVLAYRGGGGAEELFSKKYAKYEWGHVGVLFNKQNNWYVMEADGKSTSISPYDDSLFGIEEGSLHGLWEVQQKDGIPVTSPKVITAAEKIAGTPYDVNPLTSGKLQCTEVVCTSLQAGLKGKIKGRVTFTDVPIDLPLTAKLKGQHLPEGLFGKGRLPTPRWLIGSNNLKEIKVLPNVLQKEPKQEKVASN